MSEVKPREFHSDKIIMEMCNKSGVGELGEFDREAIRALKQACDKAVSALKTIACSQEVVLGVKCRRNQPKKCIRCETLEELGELG